MRKAARSATAWQEQSIIKTQSVVGNTYDLQVCRLAGLLCPVSQVAPSRPSLSCPWLIKFDCHFHICGSSYAS